MHGLLTGRSVTGCIHLVNQTSAFWSNKKQNLLETATYGSIFVAARLATEQIKDLRYTWMTLGVPIDGPAWMSGDNQSVIISSTISHSSLNKSHIALSYHRVREAIASNVMYFLHVPGVYNPANVLKKALPWITFWPLVQPLLLWKGEMVKAEHTYLIAEIIQVGKLEKAAATGLRGVTRGKPVPVIPVMQVKVVGLVSGQGVIPVTAQGHKPGQASSEPGATGNGS
jgi:hypothetical protein